MSDTSLINKRYGIAMSVKDKEVADKAVKAYNSTLSKNEKKLSFNRLCINGVVKESLRILEEIEKVK